MSRDNDSTFALGWDSSSVAQPRKQYDRPLLVVHETDEAIVAMPARYEIRRTDNGQRLMVCATGGDAVRTFLLYRQTRGCPACEIFDLEQGRVVMMEADLA